ncbi:AEC family transporter [Dialister sp.]|uniref:AEC family transporter n=1 Tax=Dialister sp. TaxID=1955814 RepID=UPI002E8157B1|nr:permease [Dialister sp.]MEE3452547.1 permease [Dialister sp.]
MAFLQIISDNILPLLVFVLIGYLLDRKYKMDVASFTKLTFFIVLPCFIFYSIYVAKIDMSMLHVFLISFVVMVCIGILATIVGRMRGFSSSKIEAFKNGTMFSNNGNIGIALIALVFSNAPYIVDGKTPYLAVASAAATMMLVQMNMFLNTLGLYQAGKGRLTPRDALSVVFHMPVIYTLVAVFSIKYSGFDMSTTFVWPILQNSAAALVAIVMVALGMQIHRSKLSFSDPDAWLGCALRLIGGPVMAYILIRVWGFFGITFEPTISQTILIMCSVPAAVNSVLYAVEFHNCEDFATELVMMSTFLSCITMTGTIYLARVLFPIM